MVSAVLPLALATAVPAAATGGKDGFLLRFRPHPPLTYKSVKHTVTEHRPHRGSPADRIEKTIVMVMEREVKRAGRNRLSVRMRIKEYHVKLAGKRIILPFQKEAAVFEMKPDGEEIPDETAPPKLFTRIPLVFPLRRLKPGDRWTHASRPTLGFPYALRVVYKLVAAKGRKVLIDVRTAVKLSKKTLEVDAPYLSAFEGKLCGRILFDRKAGVILSARYITRIRKRFAPGKGPGGYREELTSSTESVRLQRAKESVDSSKKR